MRLFQCIIVAVTVLSVQSEEDSTAQTALSVQCLRGESKKCVIPSIEDPVDQVLLPDLKDKTALMIKSGKVRFFSESFCEQLESIVKLQLGPLQIEELFLKPELQEVDVGGNHINKVLFQTKGDYKTEILDLSNNRLSSLEGFEVLINLRELSIESNLLENVDMSVFQNMIQLEKLNLRKNKISTLVAPSPVKLLQLDYLTLAGNSLSSLKVHNWEFESLTVLDLSSNNLVHVEGINETFPSLQHISLSSNGWHCVWLDEVLKHFEDSYVSIKDSDKDCEGLSPANICCVTDFESSTYEESFTKLEALEKKQKTLQPDLEQKIRDFEVKQNSKISDVKKLLEELLAKQAGFALTPLSEDELNKDQFVSVKDKVTNIKATLEEEVKKFEQQNSDNSKIQRKLGFTIVQLKGSLERETKKIAELQAQFSLLKDHVRSKLEKRSKLTD